MSPTTHSTETNQPAPRSCLTKPKLLVLISGNGSNLQALIDCIQAKKLCAEIVGVLSNKATAFGLERAKAANITPFVLSPTAQQNRHSFDQALLDLIATEQLQPDWIILAGFMRILSKAFINHFAGKILNIHPSLLPKYKGLHTHQRALESGDKKHGCSVHFVTPELDEGPLLSQAYLEIKQSDTPESLQQRVHQLEHQLYPLTLNALFNNKLLNPNKIIGPFEELPSQIAIEPVNEPQLQQLYEHWIPYAN